MRLLSNTNIFHKKSMVLFSKTHFYKNNNEFA